MKKTLLLLVIFTLSFSVFSQTENNCEYDNIHVNVDIVIDGDTVPNLDSIVTKTGTAIENQVAVWANDGTVKGFSDLVYDNNNLGVGTNVPAAKLDVHGQLSVQRNSNANTTAININAGITPISVFQYNTDFPNSDVVLNARSGWELIFSVSDDEKMKIKTNGNVGIGVMNPLSKLHVNGGFGDISTGISLTDGLSGIHQAATGELNLTVDDIQIMRLTPDTTFVDSILKVKSLFVDNIEITDLGGSGGSLFGTDNQIPFMNAGGTNFEYSNNLLFSGGALEVVDNAFNTMIGKGTGSGITTGGQNTFLGAFAGISTTTPLGNSFIGYNSGANNTEGSFNSFMGWFSGYNNTTGEFNLYLGTESGLNNNGDKNIFLGYQAGKDETGSNLLFIDNSSTAAPLIYGEFDNDILKINGTQIQSIGLIADNDATPDVSAKNVWTYNGTANSVIVTDLDNPDIGAIYRIIGNSDTFTIRINDVGLFNLAGDWIGGNDDVLTIFVQADNDYIEISRSDN